VTIIPEYYIHYLRNLSGLVRGAIHIEYLNRAGQLSRAKALFMDEVSVDE